LYEGSNFQDRPYQNEAVDAVFGEWGKGVPSTALILPTGTGKTVIAAKVIERAQRDLGWKTLFLADREILVEQAEDRFSSYGLDYGVEMAGRTTKGGLQPVVTIGSVQSMQGDRLASFDSMAFEAIIIDECHGAVAPQYARTLGYFGQARKLGITATPGRGDRQNIGSVFKTVAFDYPIRAAIEEQWLVPPNAVRCPVSVDLKGIRTTGGDFNLGDLSEAIGPKIEELCSAFHQHVGDRQAVIFTPDVGSAMAVAQVLRWPRFGRTAKYVAGDGGQFGMARQERKETLEEFNQDGFQIIVSCELLFKGWDCAQVSCVGIMRPTRMQHRYAQMVGRGLRRCDRVGKTDCLILDFDWECQEGRDLASAVDLFDDGSVPEAIMASARERMKDGETSASKAIEAAEHEAAVKARFMIADTGKVAKFRLIPYDPVGLANAVGIQLNKKHDLDRRNNNPPTEKQIYRLERLGMRRDAAMKLSKWGASKYIKTLANRREAGFARLDKLGELLAEGVQPDFARSLTDYEAWSAIKEIKGSRPPGQRLLF
jgi:superfamily II DNA or RNA helicase